MIQLTLESDLIISELPPAVDARLQALLNKQDKGITLTELEQAEAKGLTELAEFLSLIHLNLGAS